MLSAKQGGAIVGTIGTILLLKGKKVRLRESFAEDDRHSFDAAREKLSRETRALQKSAEAAPKARPQGYRKKKIAKDA
jgi:hypothetical protein